MSVPSGFVPQLAEGLLVEDVGDEALIWAEDRHEPTPLDPLTRVIFQIIDGVASIDDLVEDVHEVVGVSREIADSQVRRALSLLDAAGAFDSSQPLTVAERQRELFINPPSP